VFIEGCDGSSCCCLARQDGALDDPHKGCANPRTVIPKALPGALLRHKAGLIEGLKAS
jgi:hypothetical protein